MIITEREKVLVLEFFEHPKFADYTSEQQERVLHQENDFKDWNLLMRIIDKIESIPFLDARYQYMKINKIDQPDDNKRFFVYFNKDDDAFHHFVEVYGNTKKDATVSAIVEMVKYYNRKMNHF